jgi:hypothetical protein
MAPHRHNLVIDVTATSARTNTNVPRVGARLPLPGTLALGAQHGKLYADLRICALFGMPSVRSVHDYYPFLWRMGAGWRLWRLSWSIAWLFWWQFVPSMAWVMLILVLYVRAIMSVL